MRMKDTDTMNIGTEMIKVLFCVYPLTFKAICSKIVSLNDEKKNTSIKAEKLALPCDYERI